MDSEKPIEAGKMYTASCSKSSAEEQKAKFKKNAPPKEKQKKKFHANASPAGFTELTSKFKETTYGNPAIGKKDKNAGQIWAIYSDEDTFPNYYGQIQKIDEKRPILESLQTVTLNRRRFPKFRISFPSKFCFSFSQTLTPLALARAHMNCYG
ncbi:unnamed protein product [Fraxinus pennsylvanica]|uniref:DUF3444 domain-containing protein n=1 Tax=Fraxinus pennsylvanica TaxID=56036 RepID=A0AAD2A1I4_9LAMI|nr:unnamed protein product [Fraxinus pennsylvanica]